MSTLSGSWEVCVCGWRGLYGGKSWTSFIEEFSIGVSFRLEILSNTLVVFPESGFHMSIDLINQEDVQGGSRVRRNGLGLDGACSLYVNYNIKRRN